MADTDKAKAVELKEQGNKALAVEDFDTAVKCYTEAIQLDGSNHVLYSNRSAALTKQGKFLEALADADKTIELKKDWPKGWSRKGAALSYLHRYDEAAEVYREGLELNPNNKQLQEGLEDARSHLTGPGGSQNVLNPFAQPDLMSKLEAHPKTKEYLKQPDYQMMIKLLQQNPQMMTNIQDPRIMTTLGVLLGLEIDDGLGQGAGDAKDESPASGPSQNSTSQKEKPSTADSKPNSTLGEEQKEAIKQKELGNEAYKKKDFAVALDHYAQAHELDPTNITILTNRAAVFFEQGEYDKCIEECQKAIEVGRENRADFKLISKALARMGNAYLKKGDDKTALNFFQKSLSEHRIPDVVKKVTEIEKKIKENERLAYVNPELALKEKEMGNKCFQSGDYPTALRHYTEAIKRNPEDAKLYSNRSACYTKLMEPHLALKDSEECIKLDPDFIKGYLRKGTSLLAMKEQNRAAAAFQKALEMDPKCQEALDGYRTSMVSQSSDPEAVRQRAMSDPEVQQILQDPAMQMILQQMGSDPKAVREHLKNPQVAAKIAKLMEVGIVAMH